MSTPSPTVMNLSNSLAKNTLKITFSFPNPSLPPLQIEGLRTEVSLSQAGQESGSTAKITLHALDFEKMFQMLSGNASPLEGSPLMLSLSGANVKIEAGDQDHFLTLIFYGKIRSCHANFRPPDRLFEITAQSTLFYNETISRACAYEKPVWASQVLKELCASEEIRLENNDFDYLIQPPFSLHGTLLEQVSQIIKAQNGFFCFDPIKNKLSIGEKRLPDSAQSLLLAPEDLMGFPYCSDRLLSVRCLFQPNLTLGQSISLEMPAIESENIALNEQSKVNAPWGGKWIVHAFSHVLSSEIQGARWETSLHAHRLS